jgi:Icc-related predicted phosphoesterase
MINIQIVSDLHIEYKSNSIPDPKNYITPSADILVLAGDIGSLYKIRQFSQFLQKVCSMFRIVIYVPGNHEYYTVKGIKHMTMEQLNSRLNNIEKNIDNLFVLNRSSICINDICIIGCTLWSHPMVKIPKYIVKINDINTWKYKQLFNNDLQYINEMIKYCNNNKLRLIVVTHHCPTYETLKFAKKREKFISLYASDLDHLLHKQKVHTWICGHIHKNFDFHTSGGTRIVGNQKGKPKDKISDYSRNFVIKV